MKSILLLLTEVTNRINLTQKIKIRKCPPPYVAFLLYTDPCLKLRTGCDGQLDMGVPRPDMKESSLWSQDTRTGDGSIENWADRGRVRRESLYGLVLACSTNPGEVSWAANIYLIFIGPLPPMIHRG